MSAHDKHEPFDRYIARTYRESLEETEKARRQNIVVTPTHYTAWNVEPVEFILRNDMEFWRGNVIKYVMRCGNKLYDGMDKSQSEITDLEKAKRYIDMRINTLRGKNPTDVTE